MSNRHVSRSVALQVLFEKDANNLDTEAALARLVDYAAEFGARESDIPFMQTIIRTASAKQREIDDVIVKAAPEWPIHRISAIDRAVLRLGLTELLFSDRAQVPAKVAINEAIELAKEFGGPSSSKFVNGVLGSVYLELGEPGKEEGNKRVLDGKQKLKTEECVGAVIYAREGDQIYLALVHDIFGHWTLSKGKLLVDEHPHDGVKRKAMEEVGLEVTIEAELGENEYVANDSMRGGGRKRRHATYFLARSEFKDLTMKKDGGLDDAQWFPLIAVGDLNFYDDVLPIVTKGIMMIAQQRS